MKIIFIQIYQISIYGVNDVNEGDLNKGASSSETEVIYAATHVGVCIMEKILEIKCYNKSDSRVQESFMKLCKAYCVLNLLQSVYMRI